MVFDFIREIHAQRVVFCSRNMLVVAPEDSGSVFKAICPPKKGILVNAPPETDVFRLVVELESLKLDIFDEFKVFISQYYFLYHKR